MKMHVIARLVPKAEREVLRHIGNMQNAGAAGCTGCPIPGVLEGMAARGLLVTSSSASGNGNVRYSLSDEGWRIYAEGPVKPLSAP